VLDQIANRGAGRQIYGSGISKVIAKHPEGENLYTHEPIIQPAVKK